MPTYLTPGVYVEEVPSANKPIEGVGTAVAAFVGLWRRAGPINTPMRISNWTQFAKIYSDPQNPENGPFMEGAYLAHAVYGYFQNGGSLCWVVRVGSRARGRRRAQAALPGRHRQGRRGAPRRGAQGRQRHGQGRGHRGAPAGGQGRRRPDLQLVVSAGSESEEYEGVSLKKGRNNVATKVNAASKLVKIEETGAALPDARVAAGTYTLRRRRSRSRRSRPRTSRATSPPARAWAASPRWTR